MAFVALIFGLLLIIQGIVSFVTTGQAHPTALIPAYFGGVLALLGLVALNERMRKHAMHGAAALGLIGAVAAGSRLVVPLISGKPFDPPAAVSQLIMTLLCLAFVGLCLRSFLAARRRRTRAVLKEEYP